MFKIVDVKVLLPYKIRLKYEDGVEGIVDLSYLVGKGVFKKWEDPRKFADVHINSDGAVEWEGGIDLCPDALYMSITGKTAEEVFANLRAGTHA